MNYFGKFDAKVLDTLGQHPSAHLYSETVHANHVPADAIVVSDAQLLFGAEFKRTGVDLVLSGEGREVVLHDYFKGEHRAAIASPDGAHLTGDLVTALAGEVQVAQADGNTDAHKVIGHVTKLVGTATAMRNGVSIILNNGDNVEKGDVVSSGSDSTLGITFIDGTVFGLSANARMVLNEMVYDPNGSNNSSLLSLVAGTITFVAGETAKHGDMKVDTPVATMGIRGTAVLVEIDFSVPGATPDAKFQVLVEPDGTTGSYILFDKTTLTPLAVVDRAGTQINISNGIMSQTLAPLSPEIQKLINDVFTLKFSDNTNTKSLDHFTDSIIPTDGFGLFKFAGLNNNAPTIPVIVNLVVAESSNSNNGISTKNHIPEAPSFQSDPVVATITEQPNKTGITSADLISGQIQYFDVNTTDHDTLSVKISSFTYQNAKGQDVTGSLNSLQLKDIANVEANIGVVEPLTPDTVGNATATWTYSVADKAFDFLAAGEKLTLTYTATVDNNYQPLDQASSQTFTITIIGTNDVPVITSSQQNINFVPSGTDTKGGELIPDTTTTGKLTFTDPDLTDTHTVAVKMASALLDGKDLSATVGQVVIDELGSALTAKITAADDSTGTGVGTIEWTLADLQVYLADVVPANETLVLTYAVTVTDSQGATDTQNIVVTIGGNQPAATVWIDTTSIPPDGVALWSDAANWESDRAPTISDDVFIGTDQVMPNTPVFPATINADAQAKSLTMDYFTDFGTAIPELEIESGVTLTIAGALKLDTSTDSSSPLTAESIIKNWGTISVGGIADLLKHSVLDNYGTLTLAQGGEFVDQSSVTNSGTIEISSDTLDLTVDIVDSAIVPPSPGSDAAVAEGVVTIEGTIKVDADATLQLAGGGGIIGGKLAIAGGGLVEITYGQDGTASANGGILDGVQVTNDGTIQVDGAVAADPTADPSIIATPAATLTLDDGTTIVGGNLTIAGGATLDIEAGSSGPGATLDGVAVDGVNATESVAASIIEVGNSGAATLLLDDGTTITGGNLTIAGGGTLDVEAGKTGPGATLDGVTVSGTSGDSHSVIEIGNSGAATLLLDDGTIITNGNLTIANGATLDVEAGTTDPGATLDGVTVTGGNATESIKASVIEVGASGTATLLLDDGTTITNGNLTISPGSAIDVEAGKTGPGATLDGVAVGGTSGDNPSTIAVGGFGGPATLVLDDGTAITNGNLNIAGGSMLDVEAGAAGPGAMLDGVTVNGTNADAELSVPASAIDVGNSGAATLLLDDGTTITGGDLTIASGSTVDVESVNGATLDGVTVSGTNDPSTIEIGNSGVSTLLLDDGTTITNGDLTIAAGSTLHVEAANSGPGAALDGVMVTGTSGDSASFIEVGALGAATLLLDDGTTVTNGNLNILGGSTLDIEAGKTSPGATLHDVAVHGTNAIDMIAASTIDVGNSGAATLTLDGGTTIADGDLTIASGSTLDIESSAGATLDGVNVTNEGTIQVDGAAGSPEIVNLLLDDGTTITDGILQINGLQNGVEGAVEIGAGGAIFDNVTVTNNVLTIGQSAMLSIEDGTTINGGTIDDLGTLSVTGTSKIENATVDGGGNVSVASGMLTLSGVTLDNVTLVGNVANADTLTIDDTVTLNGATVSGGTIDDTGTLKVTAASEIENATIDGGGNLTATAAALTLSGVTLDDVTLAGSFTNADTLTIDDTVTLNSATISGGTLDISGTLDSTGTSFITGVTIDNSSNIDVLSGTLTIDPATFTNTGTIEVEGKATLVLSGETITNSTTVGLTTTNGTIQIDDQGLLTLKDSTINGGIVDNLGTIDVTAASSINNTFSFDNTGTVNADGVTLTLSGTTVSNSGGTLESTGSGLLKLVNTTINNGALAGKISTATGNSSSTLNAVTLELATLVTATVGVLELTGLVTNNGEIDANGGTVDLVSSTLDFGTLGGSGKITTVSGLNTLDGVTISHGTTVTVADHTTMELVGTITDSGTIALGSSGHATQLEISGSVSLSGGGNVTMTDVADTAGNVDNFIVSDGSAATLTNSDTISGAGTIGDSHLTLINNGTIDATGTHPLIINTGVTNNASGALEASTGSTLDINGDVTNDGTIAAGPSAHVTITGNVGTDTGATGNINIAANATVEITGTVDEHQTVDFLSQNGAGELILDDPSGFHGVVSGLLEATSGHSESAENYIDLKGFADTILSVTASYNSTTEVTAVTITNFTIANGFSSLTIDLSGDYRARDIEFATDHHGGTLFSDPTADSGAVTIDSGITLDIGGASSATITFANSAINTGELVLGDSHDFTGAIAGFTGDGTIANSDLIDAADINFANVATDKTTYTENAADTGGTLTLYNANGQALDSLNFSGSYQLANFTIENDGNGGTLIVDPPVASPTPANTAVASAANQTLTGSAPSENFVFNFANVGQSTVSNFHAATDTLQFGSAIFADAQAALNAVHDDGHGNAVLAIDAHDSITLTGVLKAQLHVGDFHIV